MNKEKYNRKSSYITIITPKTPWNNRSRKWLVKDIWNSKSTTKQQREYIIHRHHPKQKKKTTRNKHLHLFKKTFTHYCWSSTSSAVHRKPSIPRPKSPKLRIEIPNCEMESIPPGKKKRKMGNRMDRNIHQLPFIHNTFWPLIYTTLV